MSSEKQTDRESPSSGSGNGEGEGLQVEERWAEARREAGLDPGEIGTVRTARSGFVSPYLILYAGFFLGPGMSFVSSLAVAPRRLSIRRISFMLGVCGAAWCAVQGATGRLAEGWSGVQMVRSGINFAASAFLLLFWRRECPDCFLHDRRSIAVSFAVGTILLLAFLYLPPEFLASVGR